MVVVVGGNRGGERGFLPADFRTGGNLISRCSSPPLHTFCVFARRLPLFACRLIWCFLSLSGSPGSCGLKLCRRRAAPLIPARNVDLRLNFCNLFMP